MNMTKVNLIKVNGFMFEISNNHLTVDNEFFGTLEYIDYQKLAVWITSLRSGKFLQTHGELFNNGRYCCLGVLNEVCNLGEDVNNTIIHSFRIDPVARFEIGANSFQSLCYGMNDGLRFFHGEQFSFEQVADVLEFISENYVKSSTSEFAI